MTIFTKQEKYAFPAPGAAFGNAVLQFRMNRIARLSFRVDNFGAEIYSPVAQTGNNLDIRIQDSDDGVVWANVAGTTQTVVPMGNVEFVATIRPFWRVQAFGNTGGNLRVAADTTLDLTLI